MEKNILYYIKKYKHRIFILTTILIFQTLVIFLIPLLSKFMLQKAEKGLFPTKYIVYFFITLLFWLIFRLLTKNFSLKFRVEFIKQESEFLYKSLFMVKLGQIYKQGSTYFYNRIKRSLESIYNFISNFTSKIFVSILKIIISLVAIFIINKVLFFLFILIVPINFLSYRKLNTKLKKQTAYLQNITSKNSSYIVQIVRNLKTIKQIFNYSSISEIIAKKIKFKETIQKKINWFAGKISIILTMGIVIIRNLILLLTIYYYSINSFSVADIVFVNIIFNIYFEGVKKLNFINLNKREVDSSLNFINKEIMENLEDKNQTGQEIEKIETIKINISNFTYDYKKTIVKNIKIKFYKGERIGLIGKTGSGKSTIAKLLARLYNSNNIFINNKNIRNYKLKSIREK